MTFLKLVDRDNRRFIFSLTDIVLCYIEQKNELFIDTAQGKYKFIYVYPNKFKEIEDIFYNQPIQNLITINLLEV